MAYQTDDKASDQPGVKTSEFWLTVASIVVAAVMFVAGALLQNGIIEEGSQAAAIAGIVLQVASVLAAMLPPVSYNVSRAMVKRSRNELRAVESSLREETERAMKIERLRLNDRSNQG